MSSTTATAVRWRRDVHAHPEVGFCEFRTASRIAGHLADLGWDVVVGTDAMPPGRAVGRADRPRSGRAGGHHTPTLDFDEAALAGGVDLFEHLVRGR